MPDINDKKIVNIPASITIKKFSELLSLPVARVIMELMKNNIIATINEEIDFETASIIADDLGFQVASDDIVSENSSLTLEKLIEIIKKEREENLNLPIKAPIVTILGHVDHGKTTLLDTIRKTNIVAKEAGGITQHIKAYQVKKKGKAITFIDTPGHEAFSAMRERGVNIADIAVLVVAADDGVRPQTKEVIEYLKNKKIPTVVAINKIDKPGANVQKVKQELGDNGIMAEQWGGNIPFVEISAKQNIGIDDLLENILVVAEVEDFRANPKRDGLGLVLEAHLDPQKGPVSTILVKTGSFKVGQDVVAGSSWGRVRRMDDFTGKSIASAGPSMPVTMIGLNSLPNANDVIQVTAGKSNAMQMSQRLSKSSYNQGKDLKKQRAEELTGEEKIKKYRMIVKTDVQGSLEAIKQILSTIKSEEVALEYISDGVGNITESDVKIAETSGAHIFGFNVIITPVAKRLAEAGKVEIKIYSIIYELVEEAKRKMTALLPVEIIKTDLGRINILAIFKTGKHDMIVGGRVSEGKMIKGQNIEVERGDEIIGKGKLSNLQMNKNNVEECGQGNECGITFDGPVRIKEGDTLICYKEEEKKRTL